MADRNPLDAPETPPLPGSWQETYAEKIKGESKARLRTSLDFAVDNTPGEYARTRTAAQTLGVSIDLAESAPKELQSLSKQKKIMEELQNTEVLRKHFENREFSSVAQDDVNPLAEIERLTYGGPSLTRVRGPEGGVGTSFRGLALGAVDSFEKIRQGIRMQWADLLGAEDMREDAIRKYDVAETEQQITRPEFESLTAQGIYAGAESLIRQAPGLALGITTGGAGAGLGYIGLTTEAEAYGKYRTRGGTARESFLGALGEGGVEVITEMLPMKYLVDKFGKVGFGQFITGMLAREVPTEQAATIAQDAIDTAIANPDKTWGEYFAERPEAAYLTLVATVVQTSLMGGIQEVGRRSMERDAGISTYGADMAKASRAVGQKDLLDQQMSKAADSELRQNAPDQFKAFVEDILEEGDSVYLDHEEASEFFQTHPEIMEELKEQAPETAVDIATNLEAGMDVSIPKQDYMTHFANVHEEIAESVRSDADGMNVREAEQWMKEAQPIFEAEAQRIIEELDEDVEFESSAERVHAQIRDEIVKTGRFTEDVANRYAALHRAFAVTMADRLGMTPEQVYGRYGLKVRQKPKEDPVMQEYSQAPIRKAQENAVGLYSAVEQGVIDMKIPVWKAKEQASHGWAIYPPGASGYAARYDTKEEAKMNLGRFNFGAEVRELKGTKPASGKEIWQKIKSMPGIKKEELQWLGLEEFLMSGDKFTREEVEAFIQDNGVKVEETVADEEVSETEQELDWDDGEVWDDSEAWDYNVEEMMSDYDGGAEETVYKDIMGFMESWAEDNVDQVIEYYSDVLDEDTIERFDDMDADAVIEEFTEMGFEWSTDLRKKARDDFEEEANRIAEEIYMENPINIYSAENLERDVYIFGNDDQGYSVRADNWESWNNNVRDDIWSLSEAQIQAEEWAREEGILVDQDEEAAEVARWGDYVMEGGSDNYREIKIILPEIDPQFYQSAHFPDANIVAFLRVDDRGLSGKAMPVEERAAIRAEAAKKIGLVPSSEVDFESPDIPDSLYAARYEMTIGEMKKADHESLNEAAAKAEVNYAAMTPERRKLNYDQGYEIRLNEETPSLGEPLNTFFIEEFQSDWHQQGRQEGYSTGRDAGELEAQYREDLQLFDTELHAAIRSAVEKSDKATRGAGTDIFLTKKLEATEQHSVTRGGVVQSIYELLESGTTDHAYTENTGDLFDFAATIIESQDADTVHRWQQTIKNFREQQKGIKAERYGVPDAPFKGDNWMQLGMKRAILHAIEGGYEAIAWPNAEVLMDRWSDRYEKLYRTQYDTKMPSIAKKLLKTKPVELDMEGVPIEKREPVAPLSEEEHQELRTLILKYNSMGFDTTGQAFSAIRHHENWAEQWDITDARFIELGNREHAAAADEGQQGYHIIELTDELKEKVKSQGFTLFQKKTDEAKGKVQFPADITEADSVITLLENADLSTFLHESGHFFFEVMKDIASQPDAPGQIREDMLGLLKFIGVKDLDTWNAMDNEQRREGHEQVARAFEAYLFEGRAPSMEMQGLFQRFRAWLVNIYRSLASLNVKLSDEVRGVFDRMLATDNEIREKEVARSYHALFETAEEAGMTPEEWRRYQSLDDERSAKSDDELMTRSLKDMKWLSNAKSRALKDLQKQVKLKRKAMRAQVADEVSRGTLYRVITFLKKGEMTGPEGEEIKVDKGHRLQIDALKAMYPEDALIESPDWRSLGHGKYGMLAKEGLHPDLVADMFGLSSGDELVHQLVEAEPFKDAVDRITDQRMLEAYGDITSPEALDRAAEEAVHNEAHTKFLHTELKALTKKTGTRNVMAKAAREYAEEAIARKKVREIKPAQFSAAESRAAKNAEKALIQGDRESAAEHKRAQLLNNYFFKAANKGREELDKMLNYFKRFDRNSTRKALGQDYIEQIDSLLSQFDLRKGVSLRELDRRESLAAWIKAQEEMGLEPIIDERLQMMTEKKHYKNATLEEMRGLRDSIKNIEHLGRLKNRLLTAKEQRDFAEAVAKAETSIKENAKEKRKKQIETNTWADRVKKGKREWFAMHRKLSSILRQMDGWKDGGILWELFLRPMNEKGDQEAVEHEKATESLMEIFRPYTAGKEQVPFMGRLRQKLYIPAINDSLSLEGRLAVALNWGNEANRQRVMSGDGWTQEQVQAILDTLTQQDWDFVQGVWDFIDSYWSQIAEKEQRVSGVMPEKVEAMAVQTPFGEYRGGYYPIKYDPDRSTRAEADELAELTKDAMKGLYSRRTTRRGHTKERVAEVKERPVRKDFGVIFEHVDQVIHDLAWHEWLIDANRLLRAKPIDNAVRDHYGSEVLRTMKQAIDGIAAGDVPAQNQFERFINHIRTGTSIAGMGWSLWTSLLQPLGLSQSMVRVGPKWIGRGMAEWAKGAVHMEKTVGRIHEKSDFMRLRAKTLQREINEIRNRVSDGGRLPVIQDSYFYLIAKAQMVADVPTWLGAYEKAVSENNMEERAVALADQAVLDSQGGGQIKDLAQIQRGGPLLKLWTNFYSFFNTTYNLSVEAVGKRNLKHPAEIARLAVDFSLLYLVPATISAIMRETFKGECDGDEECIMRKIAAENVTYMLGTMIGLREWSSAVAGYFGYSGPAGTRFFAESSKVIQQASQMEVDEALLKSMNNAGGIVFHYPAGQVQRSVEGVIAMTEGELEGAENVTALAFGPPRD